MANNIAKYHCTFFSIDAVLALSFKIIIQHHIEITCNKTFLDSSKSANICLVQLKLLFIFVIVW